MQYAHDQNFIHRDVKPANIIINEEDGAVLTDFGLVKSLASSQAVSRTGLTMGTPEYMGTEILDGMEASPASDQFSLACVVVEMLSGASPFAAPTPMAVLSKHANGGTLPERWPEGLPPKSVEVLKKALSRKPEHRYGSINEFVEALLVD